MAGQTLNTLGGDATVSVPDYMIRQMEIASDKLREELRTGMDRVVDAVKSGASLSTNVGGTHFHQQPNHDAVTNGQSYNRDYE